MTENTKPVVCGRPRRLSSRLAWAVVALLLGLGVVYAGVGLSRWAEPLSESRGGADGARRWQQVQYMLRGVDPNALFDEVEELRAEYAAGETAGWPGVPPFFEEFRLPFQAYPAGEYPPFSYGLMVPLHGFADPAAAAAWFLVL